MMVDTNCVRTAIMAKIQELKDEINRMDQPSGKGRGKADPVADEKIFDRVQAGEKIQDIAAEKNVSRQAISKAVARVKKSQAAKAVFQTPAGPYIPSNAAIMAASELLFGKRLGTKNRLIAEAIKASIDEVIKNTPP